MAVLAATATTTSYDGNGDDYTRDDHHNDDLPVRRLNSKVLTLHKVRARLGLRQNHPLPAQGPTLGRYLYGATWGQMYHAGTVQWFQTRSASRTWAPGHGHEWAILRYAGSYTAAHHVTRFLAAGLAGGSLWRAGALAAWMK